MKSSENKKNNQTNLMYFNQMLEESGVDGSDQQTLNKAKNKKKASFASQKVEFSDYLAVPDGYESVVYPIYFVSIPYFTGAMVLFFFIAGGSLENFKLIEFNSFLVVWMIGYEIVGTLILIAVLVSFLQYEDTPQNNRHF